MSAKIKKLFINGDPSHIEFHFDSSDENIEKWVRENLNRFSLNEEHSCEISRDDKLITISGDEDLMEIEIVVKTLLLI